MQWHIVYHNAIVDWKPPIRVSDKGASTMVTNRSKEPKAGVVNGRLSLIGDHKGRRKHEFMCLYVKNIKLGGKGLTHVLCDKISCGLSLFLFYMDQVTPLIDDRRFCRMQLSATL